MAKITRKNMTVFGSNSGANQIEQFGSLAAGSPVYTTDPETIQALANYLTGWFAGVVGQNSPAIEDMNALCYLFAYQLSYILQEGVPEWSSLTNYFIGSIVQNGTTGISYVSLTDNNLNNALTDITKWAQPQQNGMVNPNNPPGNRTTIANTTMTWAYLKILTAQTFTVVANSQLVGITSINIAGTGVLVVNGTCRIL